MAEIIEKRRRYYSGLNADKVNIPAGGKAAGDRYYATDTLVEFTWTGAAWVPLGDDVVDAGMLQTDAVETIKIKNINVTAAKLATDSVETLKIKNLNVTTAKAAVGFGRFVKRDATAWDKAVGDFTTDGTWKVDGLDLSGIIPAGAIAVAIRAYVMDDAANSHFYIRRNATQEYNTLYLVTQVANIPIETHFTIPIDSNRLLDYWGSNLAFAEIGAAVMGWFI